MVVDELLGLGVEGQPVLRSEGTVSVVGLPVLGELPSTCARALSTITITITINYTNTTS